MDQLEGYGFEGGDAATLFLEGEATLDTGERIKSALLAALGSCKSLTLDLSGVNKADLSLLQLLCAAEKTCKARRLASIAVVHPSEAVIEAVQGAGVDKLDPDLTGISLFSFAVE